eukprot:gene2016-2952_t
MAHPVPPGYPAGGGGGFPPYAFPPAAPVGAAPPGTPLGVAPQGGPPRIALPAAQVHAAQPDDAGAAGGGGGGRGALPRGAKKPPPPVGGSSRRSADISRRDFPFTPELSLWVLTLDLLMSDFPHRGGLQRPQW